MKSPRIHFLLPIVTAIFLCMPSLLFARQKTIFEETHPLDRDGKVYLKNRSGDIVVNGWEKNEIMIHAIKTARHKKDLDNVIIDISQTNGNIRIVTRHASHVSVHYELYIPDNAHLRAETISGNAEIRDVGGFLEVKTISGDIKITTARDGVKCKTVSGNISMVNINGNVDIKTTSGEIEIEAVKGSVEAETVSGDIDMKGFSEADKIEIETISGDISIQGFLSHDGIYDLDSHSGKIKVALPSGSVFELQTKTFSGDIECDFELRISGKIDRKRLQGIVGKGGANLNVSTFSGDIRIIKR